MDQEQAWRLTLLTAPLSPLQPTLKLKELRPREGLSRGNQAALTEGLAELSGTKADRLKRISQKECKLTSITCLSRPSDLSTLQG